MYALKELPDAGRRARVSTSCATSRTARLPAVRAVGLAARPGARRRDPRDRVPAPLDAVPAAADAPPAEVHAGVPRPAARRDGAAPRRPPPRRRLLGRLLAREHAVPARRRPDPGLPRRRRDERGPPDRCRTASAGYDLDILVENVAFGLADLAAYHGPRGGHRRGDRRRPSRSATGYEAVWGELYDQPELIPGDRQAIRARLRRLNDLGFSVDLEVDPVGPHGAGAAADVGHDAPLPRQRARAADAHPGARGPGADPAQRPRRVPRVARVLRAPRRSTPTRPPSAGCARSTGRRWRGSPGSSGPDRDLVQAYCDVLEHKWLLSERAGATSGCEAAIESYVAEGAPAPGAAGAGDGALDGARRGGATTRTATARLELAPGRRAPRATERSALPALAGGRRRRASRRPPAASGRRQHRRVGRVAEREDVLAVHAGRVAQQLAGPRPARRRSPGSCRCPAPTRRASSAPPRRRGPT